MKRIIFIVVIIIFVFIINNLVQSIYGLWQKQDLIVSAQKELERERVENEKLKKRLAEVKGDHFIEQEARDRLLLVKPGEDVVVLPRDLIAGSREAQRQPQNIKPNWLQWWELFVKPE